MSLFMSKVLKYLNESLGLKIKKSLIYLSKNHQWERFQAMLWPTAKPHQCKFIKEGCVNFKCIG